MYFEFPVPSAEPRKERTTCEFRQTLSNVDELGQYETVCAITVQAKNPRDEERGQHDGLVRVVARRGLASLAAELQPWIANIQDVRIFMFT